MIMRTRTITRSGLLAVAITLLYACGPAPEPERAPPAALEGRGVFGGGDPDSSAAPEEDTPAPRVHDAAPPEMEAPPASFSTATLSRLARGMTPEDVRAITGVDGSGIGGDGEDVQVLRYADAEGRHFTARFDRGALRTHSGLRRPRDPGEKPTTAAEPKPPEAADGEPLAEIAPGVYVPLERAVAASTGQPRGVNSARPPEPGSGESMPLRWHAPAPAADAQALPDPSGPSIAVAGSNRRARGEDAPENRSYRPRASLPDATHSLPEGRYELRFMNPGDTPVQVGLRQDGRGLDTEVAPGDRASLHVHRGIYELYFIRESEPYTRYEADPITIDGFRTTDLEIHLDPEDVEVRLIDYSKPEQ